MEVLSTAETIQVAYKVTILTNKGWQLNVHNNLWYKDGMSIQQYSWEESDDITVTDFTLDEAWEKDGL